MKKIVVAMLLVGCLMLGGCWDKVEPSDLGVVLGVGIDVVDDEAEPIRLTIEVAEGGENQGDKLESAILTYRGVSVLDAMRHLTDAIDKQLFFGHVELIVLGKSVAEDGINQYIDYFFRTHEVSPATYLVVAEGESLDIFTHRDRTMDYLSVAIADIFADYDKVSDGRIKPQTLQGYVEEMMMNGCASLLPVLALEIDEPSEEKDGLAVFPTNMAVIDQEGLQRVQLNEEECRSALLWLGAEGRFSLPVKLSAPMEEVTFDITELTHDREVAIVNGRPHITLHIKASGTLAEVKGYTREPTFDPAEASELCAQELTRLALVAWHKSQELNEDFLLIGKDLKRQQDEYWQMAQPSWPAALNQVGVTVEVSSKIYLEGDVNRSYWKINKEI